MTTTNLPGGVTNVPDTHSLGSYVAPDPSLTHQYFNDFDLYTATDWTVTETQGGATQAILANGDGGLLALVNTAANADINAVKLANNTFVMDTSKAMWFKTRLKADNAALTNLLVGLVDTMTGLNPAYGIYITRNAAAGTLTLSVENNSVVTSSAPVVVPVANDTFQTLAIVYDPDAGTVTGYAGEWPFAAISVLTNFPANALAPAVGMQNASAVARTATVDYIFAAKERVNIPQGGQ